MGFKDLTWVQKVPVVGRPLVKAWSRSILPSNCKTKVTANWAIQDFPCTWWYVRRASIEHHQGLAHLGSKFKARGEPKFGTWMNKYHLFRYKAWTSPTRRGRISWQGAQMSSYDDDRGKKKTKEDDDYGLNILEVVNLYFHLSFNFYFTYNCIILTLSLDDRQFLTHFDP